MEKHPFLTNPTNNPFKDNRGQWRTRSLFYELKHKGMEPMFTLKEAEYKGLPSIKQIYMSYNHIPGYEYEFAMEVFGGWEHWCKLAEGCLRDHVKQWRLELDVKLKAQAIKSIIDTASSNDKSALQAAKYLSDKGYIQQDKPTRGRPSKEERERALKEDKMIKNEFDEDLKRLGIIQGGKK